MGFGAQPPGAPRLRSNMAAVVKARRRHDDEDTLGC